MTCVATWPRTHISKDLLDIHESLLEDTRSPGEHRADPVRRWHQMETRCEVGSHCWCRSEIWNVPNFDLFWNYDFLCVSQHEQVEMSGLSSDPCLLCFFRVVSWANRPSELESSKKSAGAMNMIHVSSSCKFFPCVSFSKITRLRPTCEMANVFFDF